MQLAAGLDRLSCVTSGVGGLAKLPPLGLASGMAQRLGRRDTAADEGQISRRGNQHGDGDHQLTVAVPARQARGVEGLCQAPRDRALAEDGRYSHQLRSNSRNRRRCGDGFGSNTRRSWDKRRGGVKELRSAAPRAGVVAR